MALWGTPASHCHALLTDAIRVEAQFGARHGRAAAQETWRAMGPALDDAREAPLREEGRQLSNTPIT